MAKQRKAYANQNAVIIKKTPCQKDFLQISVEEWEEAARACKLKFGAFKLYLYLASNAIGYEFLLSQVAACKALGFATSTYYDSIDVLEDLGYLIDLGDGKMEFYTKRQNSATVEIKDNNINSAAQENSNFSDGAEIKINQLNSTVAEIKKNDLNSGVQEKKENSAVPEIIRKFNF